MQKGNIGVTTENIFPVIKKFLYSDHEIFIREIVSNAVDATQKLKTLANKGDFKGETGEQISITNWNYLKEYHLTAFCQGFPSSFVHPVKFAFFALALLCTISVLRFYFW